MKKIFSLAVIMIVICTSLSQLNAQSSTQVAILKHDSTISVFYGGDAFVNAYNAADTGDVITLSKGSFNSTDIRKKLTIRGAGMEADGTLMTGTYRIYADSLTLEGLYFTDNLYFHNACRISMTHVSADYINTYNNSVVRGMITNCRIERIYANNSVISYINSYIQDPASSTLSNYINCIVRGTWLHGFYDNCILIYSNNSYALFYDNTTTSNNCVAFSTTNSSNFTTGSGTHTNLRRVTSSIFQNFQTIGSDISFQSFELTESAKTTYLGGDSTQVGWYGGYVPFTQYSTPRISNLSVSRSTTTDGQLSVSVTIDDGTTNNDEE